MTFQGPPRVYFREIFGPIVGLKDEWRAQGARDEELDLSAFRYRQALTAGCGINTGYAGPDLSRMIEETDEHFIFYDARGVKSRLVKGAATLALPMEYPVRRADDWLRIKPHYRYGPGRVPEDVRERIAQLKADGYVVTAGIPGAYDEVRVLMGDEEAAIGGYTQPDLVDDILGTIAETAERVLDEAMRDEAVDMLTVHEDMAGKSGPLWGPAQTDRFLVPYYRRLWEVAAGHGARLFLIDTDGNCNAILPSLIAGGINFFHPCEAAAGMDIVAMRERFGRSLALEGGLDKFALRADKAAIEADLERKVPPMVRTGGCVLALDHRIPNGVPIANYRFYIEKTWEILEREESGLPR
jgi:hypothetical protein